MQRHEAEQLTRPKRIHPRLAAASWTVSPRCEYDQAIELSHGAVKELTALNDPADFGLCDDHKVQSVVEAKKVTLGTQAVLTKAQYEETRAVGRGGNQPAVNGQKVRDLLIPIPTLPEQAEIVRRVDQLFSKADDIAERSRRATTVLHRASQAILAKVLRGELSMGARE